MDLEPSIGTLVREPSRWERLMARAWPAKMLRRYGKKALGVADAFLGSIPGVEAIHEFKEVLMAEFID